MDKIIEKYFPKNIPSVKEMARLNKKALKEMEDLANQYKKAEEAYGEYVFKVIQAIHDTKES